MFFVLTAELTLLFVDASSFCVYHSLGPGWQTAAKAFDIQFVVDFLAPDPQTKQGAGIGHDTPLRAAP